MPQNGQRTFLNDMELERYIQELPTRELLEFTARQAYDTSALCEDNKKRIVAIERGNHRITGIFGGIGTGVGAAIVTIISYFRSG